MAMMRDNNWLLKAQIKRTKRKNLEISYVYYYTNYYKLKKENKMLEDASDYWQEEAENLAYKVSRFENLWDQTVISKDELNRLSILFAKLDSVVNDPDSSSDDVYDFARYAADEWGNVEEYLLRIIEPLKDIIKQEE